MRHSSRLTVVWVLVAVGVVGALVVFALVRPRPPKVETVRLERSDVVHTLVLRGRLQRRVDVDVRPAVAGWVMGGVPEIGRSVEKGERLLSLRAQDPFLAQVTAALAQQNDARQALRRLARVPVYSPVAGRLLRFEVTPGAQVGAGQALATVAPSSPAGAEAQPVSAPLAGQVLPFLVGPGDVVAPEGGLPLLFLVPASGRAETDSPLAAQATARLIQANAELERLAALAERRYPDPAVPLDRVFVLAPLRGEVTWRALGLVSGSPVSPEAKVLAIASTDRIVLATVHEVDYPSLDAGQPVSVTFDAYPDRSLEASFVSKSLTPAQSVFEQFSEYTAVFALAGQLPGLADGMSCNLTVTVESRPAAESVPVSALVRKDGRSFVWVRTRDRFRSVPVEPGLVGDMRAEIRSGLGPSDEVVLKPEMLPKAVRAAER